MVMVGWLGLVLVGLTVGVTTDGRLVQFPSFPGRQFSQDFFAFIQAQPLQELDLLHLCTYQWNTPSPPPGDNYGNRQGICLTIPAPPLGAALANGKEN